MSFDPWNRFLKFQKSTETPSPKVKVALGVWEFTPPHFPTFPGVCDVTPKLFLGPHPCNPFALVASPKLGLRQRVKGIKKINSYLSFCFGKWKPKQTKNSKFGHKRGILHLHYWSFQQQINLRIFLWFNILELFWFPILNLTFILSKPNSIQPTHALWFYMSNQKTIGKLALDQTLISIH